MIQHLGKNPVSSNTSSTEQVEIVSTSLGRDDLQYFTEKHLLAQIIALKKANYNLVRDRILLDRHNQALHHCWQEALQNYNKQYQDYRRAKGEILILREEVKQLQDHLNPKEIAA